MRGLISVIIIMKFAGSAAGQHIYTIYVDHAPKQTYHADTLTIKEEVNNLLVDYWHSGYLFAGIDSVKQGNGSTEVFLHRGEKSKIKTDSLVIVGMDQPSGGNPVATTSKNPISGIRKVLENWSNNGYPYARVTLGNFRMDSLTKAYQVTLEVDPGPYIVYDSIEFLSGIKTSKWFIYRSYGLMPGNAFREADYRAIRNRTERIPFFNLKTPPDISFSSGKATIFLRLEEREMNSFEGMIGVFPGQTSDQRLLISGSLDLTIQNLFWTGKYLAVHWQKFAEQSQELDLDYTHPFFLETPLRLDVGFALMKQDSSFIQRNWQLGLGHFLTDRLMLTAGYQRGVGDLLTTDLEHISRESYADYHLDMYSLALTNDFSDRPFGVRSGLRFGGKIAAGKKQIDKNPSLPEVFYDSLTANTSILTADFSGKAQKIVVGTLAIFQSLQMGIYLNEKPLRNEWYRIGGFSTLRGFNEKFFFSQHYAFSQLELRQYFDEYSYFMLFYDQAVLRGDKASDWQWPFGIGTGFSMATNQGLLTFALAIGKSKEIPFEFGNTKAHIGYISMF